MEKIKCVVCDEKYSVDDYNFYGYVKDEPICYPCYEDLALFLDVGFKPSEVRDEK